jgi:hypothetical protein
LWHNAAGQRHYKTQEEKTAGGDSNTNKKSCMKVKFIIARAATNGHWNYYNENHRDKKLPAFKNSPPIVNELIDCFINGSIHDATQFETYEQAQLKIEWFGTIELEQKEGNEVIKTYPGVGIYRIDKIFIHELP